MYDRAVWTGNDTDQDKAIRFFFRARLLPGIVELLQHPDGNVRIRGAELAGVFLSADGDATFEILPDLSDKLEQLRDEDGVEEVRGAAAKALDLIVDGWCHADNSPNAPRPK